MPKFSLVCRAVILLAVTVTTLPAHADVDCSLSPAAAFLLTKDMPVPLVSGAVGCVGMPTGVPLLGPDGVYTAWTWGHGPRLTAVFVNGGLRSYTARFGPPLLVTAKYFGEQK